MTLSEEIKRTTGIRLYPMKIQGAYVWHAIHTDINGKSSYQTEAEAGMIGPNGSFAVVFGDLSERDVEALKACGDGDLSDEAVQIYKRLFPFAVEQIRSAPIRLFKKDSGESNSLRYKHEEEIAFEGPVRDSMLGKMWYSAED